MLVENKTLLLSGQNVDLFQVSDWSVQIINFHKVDFMEVYYNDIPNAPLMVRIEKVGQRDPGISDEVVVSGEILIGNVDSLHLLPNHICFGRRLKLLGEFMEASWGYQKEYTRHRTNTFYAYTWAAAFSEALDCCHKEVKQLIVMHENRCQALLNAA